MNKDPVNEIHTGQQSTNEGLNKELEGYFRSSKAINWYEQLLTPNRHPSRDLPQSWGERKYVNQIFYIAHRKFSNIPWENFQDQWTLIQ